MGFVILLFQSILKFDFVKASIAFALIQVGSVVFFETKLAIALIKLAIFIVFSFLVDKFEDSILKWILVLVSAGLIFG